MFLLTETSTVFPGDIRDSANGDGTGLSSKRSAATRMVTRLRNPESKLSQMKSQQVAAAVHEANKGFKEGKEVRRSVDDNDFALSDNEWKSGDLTDLGDELVTFQGCSVIVCNKNIHSYLFSSHLFRY